MRSHRLNIEKREKSRKSQRIRIFVFLIFLELCFAFLIYRVFSFQYVQRDKLQLKATSQHIMLISVGGKRGDICDRNFQPLAIRVKSYSLYADPSRMEDRESVAQIISPILNMSKDEIMQKLKSSDYFVWLKRQLPVQVADQIGSLCISGLGFREEGKRYYPKGNLAAHVIGFVGLDNMGLEGVEKAYDQYIRGNMHEIEIQKDRKGRDLKPQAVGYDKDTFGYDVVLTIDEVIQNTAEIELKRACDKWQANGGSVIIMDPRTGEILALANYPTYDLNKAIKYKDDVRRNRAIIDLYEPGSVFKIVTAAAAVNENLFNMGDQINCENGMYVLNGRTIHDVHGYSLLTFSEVVEKSSNIGITKVADRLGDRRLYNYIEAFGLTGKTGFDLSESYGYVRPLENWSSYSMASIPYGQEVAVTALQMLCATNAIANDGVIMKPFIVRSIMDGQSKLIEFPPQQVRAPISSRTANIMKEILVRAVENGTGKSAKVNGYRVAGKTGTAQKSSGRGGYLLGKYVSSFTGFLPAENPVISIIVVIDEPHGGHLSGIVACPVFNEIAMQVMQYLNVGQRFYAAGGKPTG